MVEVAVLGEVAGEKASGGKGRLELCAKAQSKEHQD